MLGKLFAKKGYSENKNNFKLCIINENDDNFCNTLGITKERSEELGKTLIKAFNDHELKTEAYQIIFDECKHANEIALCFEIYASLHSKKSSMMSTLKKLFENE